MRTEKATRVPHLIAWCTEVSCTMLNVYISVELTKPNRSVEMCRVEDDVKS